MQVMTLHLVFHILNHNMKHDQRIRIHDKEKNRARLGFMLTSIIKIQMLS